MRGFKNMDTAQLLTDAWLVYYNFMKEHSALGNIPPAQKMGTVPFKDWVDIISTARTAPEVKLEHYVVSRKPATKKIAKARVRKRITRRKETPPLQAKIVRPRW